MAVVWLLTVQQSSALFKILEGISTAAKSSIRFAPCSRAWAKFMWLPWQPPFADNCLLWLCQVSAEAGAEEFGGRCWAAGSTEDLGIDTAPRINWESGKCDGTPPQVSAQSSRRRKENGRSDFLQLFQLRSSPVNASPYACPKMGFGALV